MRIHALALFSLSCLMIACGEEPVAEPASIVPVTDPKPNPVEYPVDNSFSTDEATAAWLDSVEATATQISNLSVDYGNLNTFVQSLTFDEASLREFSRTMPNYPYLPSDGLCQIEYYGEAEIFHMTVDEAHRLAKQTEDPNLDKEWQASRYFISHNMTVEAHECLVALRQEDEWKAVGRLAIELGNFDLIDQTLDSYRELDRVSDIHQLMNYAVQIGHLKTAQHIAGKMEWNYLAEIPLEQLQRRVACGDVDLLAELIPYQLKEEKEAAQQGTEFGFEQKHSEYLLGNIALFGQKDRQQALAYAREALAWDGLNVVVLYSNPDYGDYDVVQGSLAFWQLIKSDPALADSYLRHVDAWFQQVVTHDDGWKPLPPVVCAPNEIYEIFEPFYFNNPFPDLLVSVGQGDVILRDRYLWHLDHLNEDVRSDGLAIAVMRHFLGRPWDIENPRLTQAARYQIAFLSGHKEKAPPPTSRPYYLSQSSEYVIFQDGSILDSTDLGILLRSGHLSKAAAVQLFTLLQIHVDPYTGSSYSKPEDVQLAMGLVSENVSRGEWDRALPICHGLLVGTRTDKCESLLDEQGFLSTKSPQVNGYIHDLLTVTGNTDLAKELLVQQLLKELSDQTTPRFEWQTAMGEELSRPLKAMQTNATAFAHASDELQKRDVPSPHDLSEVNLLLQPAIPVVCKYNPGYCGYWMVDRGRGEWCVDQATVLLTAGDPDGAAMLKSACSP